MQDVKWLGMAVLWLGLAAGPGLAETDTPPPAGENVRTMDHKKGGFGRGLAAELGLSAEKATELKNLMHETQKTMIKLKAERDLAKAELEHLLNADTLDEKTILAAADKLAQINAEMTKAQVKARLAMRAMLTPEQRARMQHLRQGMMERFKDRREERPAQGHERRNRFGDPSGTKPESDPGSDF